MLAAALALVGTAPRWRRRASTTRRATPTTRLRRQEGRLRAGGDGLRPDRRLGRRPREALEPLGVTFEIRDPNWSTDAGAQAITSLISEKPDVMVVHNPDVQSYARLLKKAEEAGIYVVQVNMRSSYSTDAFVGADYVGMGEQIGQRLVDKCSPANGGSGKVAITQGVLTAAASIYQMQGINNVLSKHPEIQVVSNQAADWDATKAKNIAATVIQQNPDLCAITGFWDVMDVGTAAAIKESGKNVYLLTQGGGNRRPATGWPTAPIPRSSSTTCRARRATWPT